MGAQNLNFAPKLEIFSPKFCIFGRKFWEEENCQLPKIWGNCSPAVTPLLLHAVNMHPQSGGLVT